MSVEPKELCRSFMEEVLSGGELDRIDEFVSADVVEHEEVPGQPPGRDGVRAFLEMTHAAFPDFRVEIEQLLAEGDTVVIRSRFLGTHEGEFMGIPATGREMDMAVIDILRVADDKIVEHWGITDTMAMMEQLGAIDAAPPASA
jgi:steroid delta-isomerase-like uncharacterized protein